MNLRVCLQTIDQCSSKQISARLNILLFCTDSCPGLSHIRVNPPGAVITGKEGKANTLAWFQPALGPLDPSGVMKKKKVQQGGI